jgi:hypothetical protein
VSETYLYTLRKLQSSGKLAKATFSNDITVLDVFFGLSLSGHDQLSGVEVDLDVVLREAGELERRSDDILLDVLMEIHAIAAHICVRK